MNLYQAPGCWGSGKTRLALFPQLSLTSGSYTKNNKIMLQGSYRSEKDLCSIRLYTILGEDLNLISSTHVRQLPISYNSSSRGIQGPPGTHAWMCTSAYTYTLLKKIKVVFFKTYFTIILKYHVLWLDVVKQTFYPSTEEAGRAIPVSHRSAWST